MYVCMCMYERRYYCIVNIYVCKKVCEYIYALQTFGITSHADRYVCMYVCRGSSAQGWHYLGARNHYRQVLR